MQRRQIMIIVASLGVVGLVCLCLTGVAGGTGAYLWSQDMLPFLSTSTEITIRVSDETDGTAIPRAGIILFASGERYVENTDTQGTTSVTLNSLSGLSLVVEANGYEVEEFNRVSVTDDVLNVSLKKHAGDAANVVVLVTDESLEAIKGAEVVLLVEGDTFSQPTDSNGVAKFPMTFQSDTLEALMRVNTSEYEIDSQNVTLLPNKVQGIKLNLREQTLAQVAVEPTFREDASVAASFSGTSLGAGSLEAGVTLNDQSLAQDEHNDHPFVGAINTPLLFTVQRTAGELGYSIEILDPNGVSIKTVSGAYGRPLKADPQEFPFTPDANGTYTFRVHGFENPGSYLITMNLISEPASGRNQVKALNLDGSQQGRLAIGAYDDYNFAGSVNTPLLFTVQRTEGQLGYWIEIFDPNNVSIKKATAAYGRAFRDGTHTIPLTPETDGTHTIRVHSTESYGSYLLNMKLISGPVNERNQVKTLELEGSQQGSLAIGSDDKYNFNGTANTPLSFTLQRTDGNLGYLAEILNSDGVSIENFTAAYGRPFRDGTHETTFTPEKK